MANQELFKQAIAEAKTIRDVAISNAKEVLEESITPHLKELLAARLQEMEEEDEDKDMVKEVEVDEEAEMENEEVQAEAEVDDEKEEDEESEDELPEDEKEEEMDIEDMDVEDLKNLIRDIVSQEMGGQMGDEYGEEEMDMNMDMDMTDADSEMQPGDMEDDENIDLDELLAELDQLSNNNSVDEAKKKAKPTKADDAKKKKEEEAKKKKEEDKTKKELNEALRTIQVLSRQLQETNTLNAKLLYLNKVFRANNLTESQKASIITAFDKAVNVKEVKLVYEAVKDSFDSKPANKKSITENRGFASAPQGNSTRPKNIVEVDEQVLRMQKLAGIIK